MRHLFLLAALFCACISYAQIRVQERLPKSKTGFALTTAKTRAKIYYDVNDALVIKQFVIGIDNQNILQQYGNRPYHDKPIQEISLS